MMKIALGLALVAAGSAMSACGGALAAAGRYADATRHTVRALELEPGYPPAVANLQRLQRIGMR